MQIRNSFDRETLVKIGKGALIAMSGAAAIGLLQFFGSLDIDNPALATLVAFAVPVIVNAIKEYKSGMNQ